MHQPKRIKMRTLICVLTVTFTVSLQTANVKLSNECPPVKIAVKVSHSMPLSERRLIWFLLLHCNLQIKPAYLKNGQTKKTSKCNSFPMGL